MHTIMLAIFYGHVIAYLGYCDEPETPANGDKVVNGNLEGDTVTYSCNNGFNLSGDASRTCRSNGEWSGTQPKCNRTFNTAM